MKSRNFLPVVFVTLAVVFSSATFADCPKDWKIQWADLKSKILKTDEYVFGPLTQMLRDQVSQLEESCSDEFRKSNEQLAREARTTLSQCQKTPEGHPCFSKALSQAVLANSPEVTREVLDVFPGTSFELPKFQDSQYLNFVESYESILHLAAGEDKSQALRVLLEWRIERNNGVLALVNPSSSKTIKRLREVNSYEWDLAGVLKRLFFTAAIRSSVNAMRVLVEKGPLLTKHFNFENRDPDLWLFGPQTFYRIIISGALPSLKFLTENLGLPLPLEASADHWNVLHKIGRYMQTEILEYLLKKMDHSQLKDFASAEWLDSSSKRGRTPLLLAIESRTKVTPEIRIKMYRLLIPISNINYYWESNLLHFAGSSRNFEAAKCLMETEMGKTLVLERDLYDRTPLMQAIGRDSNRELVKFLIPFSDLDARDNLGRTAFEIALTTLDLNSLQEITAAGSGKYISGVQLQKLMRDLRDHWDSGLFDLDQRDRVKKFIQDTFFKDSR